MERWGCCLATLFLIYSELLSSKPSIKCYLELVKFFSSLSRDMSVSQSVLSLNRVQLFATPWIAARQASLFITNFWSSLRLTSIESVMPSSHLILCRPLLLLPPIPPSIRVFSSESALHMRWPKYWSFSFSIIPPKKSQGNVWLPKSSFLKGWIMESGQGSKFIP